MLSQVADIWSCGVMLYVMMVGAYPFERPEDKNDTQKLQKMIQVEHIAPATDLFRACIHARMRFLPLPDVSAKKPAPRAAAHLTPCTAC